MPKILFFTCIISLSLANGANAQWLRLTQIRVGFDPIFTASQLTGTVYSQNNFINYKNWEANIEFLGPYRLSFLGEFGKTDIKVSADGGSFYYFNSGYYTRWGFNFDLAKPNKDYEYDLGWRLGFSNSTMQTIANLHGDYWGGQNTGAFRQTGGQNFWFEVLLDAKSRVFKNKKGPLGNIWVGCSLRGKFMPFFASERQSPTVNYIPGYGAFNPLGIGIQFNLFYAIHLLGPNIHKCKHLHDNVDFIENKSHQYKIRRHTLNGDELDRD